MLMSTQFWRLEVSDQGALRVVLVRPLPGLQTLAFLLCPQSLSSVTVGGEVSGVSSSYKDTSPIRLGPHSYDLI